MSRPSLEFQQAQERLFNTSNAIQTRLQQANTSLRLVQDPTRFNQLDPEESGVEFEETENRDPGVLAVHLAAQTQFLRKLKFQYLEQNAKDRYVKSIVSDIDDAPIVTAKDVKDLSALNIDKKAQLKKAKATLAEMQNNIRTLAPLVEQDYTKTKAAIDKVTALAQQITDARLALTRLRQTHPQPRLTVAAADQKLADQVTEMQELSDQVEAIRTQVKDAKEGLKAGNVELEHLRAERAEAEKLAKNANVGEDDPRIAPLYDWFTASIAIQRTLHGPTKYESVSDNELRLSYTLRPDKTVSMTFIFLPDTRQLATATVLGTEDDFSELIDAHIQTNDVHGLIEAILARVNT